MASYGYARVSTLDQNLTVQRQASRAAGCGVTRIGRLARLRGRLTIPQDFACSR
jgi:hypothetical protein